jgi:hypothetical protein
MSRSAQLVAVVAAAVAVSVSGALAAADRPSEQVRVVAAVRAYVATSGCCEIDRVAVAGVRLAAVDHEYAAVALDGFDSEGRPLGSVTAVLHRELGVWHVLALGSDGLGCGITSAAVRADLGVGCARPVPER